MACRGMGASGRLAFLLCVVVVWVSGGWSWAEHASAGTGKQCLAGGVRKPCSTSRNVTGEAACAAAGCCWSPIAYDPNGTNCPPGTGVPACFAPNHPVSGYRVVKRINKDGGMEAYLMLAEQANLYGNDVTYLHVNVEYSTKSQLRVTITDASKERWRVPANVLADPPPGQSFKPSAGSERDYDLVMYDYPFGFAVVRRATGETLFNTSSPSDGSAEPFNGLVFEDQYLEISTQMPKDSVLYGLGERVHPLSLNRSSAYYTFFAADNGGVPFMENQYGSHPFYMELRRSSNQAHGVFLFNSNGMDIYAGTTSLTYRVIGGVLDFFFFTGPSPAAVVDQYTQLIGRPYMPPYWALGWNQCRYGYRNISMLEYVVEQYAKHQIPLDSIWNDIDYMDAYLDFTFDPFRYPLLKMRSFVERLHNNSMNYVLIVDSGIANITGYSAYDQGLGIDVFIKDSKGMVPFIGKVWPGYTAWTDYFHPDADSYWTMQFRYFLETVPIDGVWLDMNEPSNFCDGECAPEALHPVRDSYSPDHPPYAINNKLCTAPLYKGTVSMDAKQYISNHYNLHNLYGFSEIRSTYNALRQVHKDKRPVIIARSTFPGAGRFAGHWLGDNKSLWPDLYNSIPGMLNFQLFGIPLVGADVCGGQGDTTLELCSRWMQVGALSPFARSHNALGSIPQEPYVWPELAKISRHILSVRYSLLPYYYTLFHRAHVAGDTVLRPLSFEFTDDVTTWTIDRQFMIGPHLLVSPVLVENATSVRAYIPQSEWYDFYDLTPLQVPTPSWQALYAPLEKINIHIRAGAVLPIQNPALTTLETRKNPFQILAVPQKGRAHGWLYQDAGDGYEFEERGEYLLIEYVLDMTPDTSISSFDAKVLVDRYAPASTAAVENITILNVPTAPRWAMLNSQVVPYVYSAQTRQLNLFFGKGRLPLNLAWRLTWGA